MNSASCSASVSSGTLQSLGASVTAWGSSPSSDRYEARGVEDGSFVLVAMNQNGAVSLCQLQGRNRGQGYRSFRVQTRGRQFPDRLGGVLVLLPQAVTNRGHSGSCSCETFLSGLNFYSIIVIEDVETGI